MIRYSLRLIATYLLGCLVWLFVCGFCCVSLLCAYVCDDFPPLIGYWCCDLLFYIVDSWIMVCLDIGLCEQVLCWLCLFKVYWIAFGVCGFLVWIVMLVWLFVGCFVLWAFGWICFGCLYIDFGLVFFMCWVRCFAVFLRDGMRLFDGVLRCCCVYVCIMILVFVGIIVLTLLFICYLMLGFALLLNCLCL